MDEEQRKKIEEYEKEEKRRRRQQFESWKKDRMTAQEYPEVERVRKLIVELIDEAKNGGSPSVLKLSDELLKEYIVSHNYSMQYKQERDDEAAYKIMLKKERDELIIYKKILEEMRPDLDRIQKFLQVNDLGRAGDDIIDEAADLLEKWKPTEPK